MNFFKTVFADVDDDDGDYGDLTPPDSPQSRPPDALLADSAAPPSPAPTWSLGGIIKTLATKSESMIETYRRDLEELGSGLKKETAVIREVASRAVKDLPASLEVGASVAQESLETVGQAIDDIGSTVWKSTAQIISHGRESILAHDHHRDSDSDDESRLSVQQQQSTSSSSEVKRYSRFETQLRALRCDLSTYCKEPEDEEDYEEWRSGRRVVVVEEKKEEIETLINENGDVKRLYDEVVPSQVNIEVFWNRYFYRLHKLQQAEEARAKLVKLAISGDEEDLSWDFDDDENGGSSLRGESGGNVGRDPSKDEENYKSGDGKISGVDKVHDQLEEKGAVVVEGKVENAGSSKDSDISVVSGQSLLPEEEDLGWDEIEDIGSNDESKGEPVGNIAATTNRLDLRKRLSLAEEEEDLTWDIEDDEPAKQ